jgi:hypothetical protein
MSGFIKNTDGIDEIVLQNGSLKINVPKLDGSTFSSFYVLYDVGGVIVSSNSTGTPGIKINTTGSVDII